MCVISRISAHRKSDGGYGGAHRAAECSTPYETWTHVDSLLWGRLYGSRFESCQPALQKGGMMKAKVIQIPSKPPTPEEKALHYQQEEDIKLCTDWALNVELTFPIKDEDVKLRYHGDAEVDFARRAVERIRPALDRLLQQSDLAGYHLSPTPEGHLARRVIS